MIAQSIALGTGNRLCYEWLEDDGIGRTADCLARVPAVLRSDFLMILWREGVTVSLGDTRFGDRPVDIATNRLYERSKPTVRWHKEASA